MLPHQHDVCSSCRWCGASCVHFSCSSSNQLLQGVKNAYFSQTAADLLYLECSLLSRDTRVWSVEHLKAVTEEEESCIHVYDLPGSTENVHATSCRRSQAALKHFWGNWAFLEQLLSWSNSSDFRLFYFLHHRRREATIETANQERINSQCGSSSQHLIIFCTCELDLLPVLHWFHMMQCLRSVISLYLSWTRKQWNKAADFSGKRSR